MEPGKRRALVDVLEAVDVAPAAIKPEALEEALRAAGFMLVRSDVQTHPAGHAIEAMQRTVDTETAKLERQARGDDGS
jgi:hypothetical protein